MFESGLCKSVRIERRQTVIPTPFLYVTTLIALPLLIVGCTNRLHTPYSPTPGGAFVANSPTEPGVFGYDLPQLEVGNHALADAETRHHRVRYLSFPSVGTNGQPGNVFTAHYYQSKSAEPKKLIIVLPVWGPYDYPSEKIGKGLRRRQKNQANILVMEGKNYLFDWESLGTSPDQQTFLDRAAAMAERMRTAVIDLRRILDWAERQPEIDASQIGLVGFSMSAVLSALLITNDSRISATALVMGTARPADVIAVCPARLGEVRQQVLERFDWTADDYRNAIEPLFEHVDPAAYPGRVDPSRVIIFDAHFDDCMPKPARDALWETLHRPERISFLYKHKTSFLAMTPLGFNYMRKRIYEFMDAKLD